MDPLCPMRRDRGDAPWLTCGGSSSRGDASAFAGTSRCLSAQQNGFITEVWIDWGAWGLFQPAECVVYICSVCLTNSLYTDRGWILKCVGVPDISDQWNCKVQNALGLMSLADKGRFHDEYRLKLPWGTCPSGPYVGYLLHCRNKQAHCIFLRPCDSLAETLATPTSNLIGHILYFTSCTFPTLA